MRKANVASYIINGEEWVFYVMSNAAYCKKFDKGSAAITTFKDKTVHINILEFSMETIVHELFHILMSQTNVGSAYLDPDQVEEVGAEIVAKFYLFLPAWAAEIKSKLSK